METNSYFDSKILTQMPKIDLHRHLEGSIRLNTLHEIAKVIGIEVDSKKSLSSKVQIQPEDQFTLVNFLTKFSFLRQFYQSKEIIQRISSECIEDAMLDNIRYLELRFTPAALSNHETFKFEDVISWVLESIVTSSKQSDIEVRSIISLNRHESVEKAERIFSASKQFMKYGLVGFDLSGDEKNFSAINYEGLFEKIKNEGFFITIHAGEWGKAENIRHAILNLHADRIGHGVRILDDPEIVELARNHATLFEVCVSSNIHSGVFRSIENHPVLKMMENGLNISINTDDPMISQIRLSSEYQILLTQLGFSHSNILSFLENAIRSSFLNASEKKALYLNFSFAYHQWLKKYDHSNLGL